FPETWRTIALMEDNPESRYFDLLETPEKETAVDIARKSFQSMLERVAKHEAEGKKLQWDAYNITRINHLARLPGLSSDILSVGGTGTALNAISRSAGPSWRMVVELGEEVKAWGIYPGGQSGHPGSPYYNSMTDDWANGRYNELHFVKTPEALADHVILTQQFQ
ncbi:MAG: penicillin acylase family protein, partial [Bacteroidota bacterium]